MPNRFAWLGALRRCVTALIILGAAGLTASPSFGQPAPANQSPETIRPSLDRVEAALARESLSAAQMAELRQLLAAARDTLRTQLTDLEPRLAEADAVLKQLGPPPAKEAAPEPPDLAAERERLTQAVAELDSGVKQARLSLLRTDQLGERLTDRRHTLYARELLERSPSAIDPSLWIEAGGALPWELRSLRALLQSWGSVASDAGGWVVAAAAVCVIALLVAAGLVRRWWRRLYDQGPSTETRLAKARAGLWVFISVSLLAPFVLLLITEMLAAFGLLPSRVREIAASLTAGVLVAAFGRGVARGLFAPERSSRRLLSLDDTTAQSLHDHLVWSTRIFGAAIFLQAIHKVLLAPLILTVATNVLFAAAIAALLIQLIGKLRDVGSDSLGDARLPWLRPLAWLLIATTAVALLAGYSGFAAFIALRAVVAAAVLGALYLLLVVVDALFTDTLSTEGVRARAIAANLGIAPRNIGLAGTLLSAGIRVVLIVLAIVLIVGPWEASTADLFESVRSIPLGFRVGDITFSVRSFFSAVAVLIAALLITRWVQRWLQKRLLPQTTLEPSLQLSIVTVFGYLGVIVAISMALAGLGIDLQKIAFVAGALSVGIGFGLQAIVSNFVSGLILLAERPIRVGDAIVVKGEEGWVRRIRVRATEIETYERASVIVPNSELITGLVKNWTHANTLSRIIVKIGVGYDSDPDQVRDILLSAATGHPQIVRSPPPRVFLVAFGDSTLDFELRCVVANVENGLSVKSDLHFAILKGLREARIAVPLWQREVRARRQEEQNQGPAPQASSLPAPS